MVVMAPASALAQEAPAQAAPAHAGGEANLVLPDLSLVTFQGIDGHTLLLVGVAD